MSYKKVDFSKFTSIGIGPVSNIYIIKDINDIPKNHTLIGHGNNLLIASSHPPLMMLGKKFDYIYIKDDELIIGAATPTGKVVSFCKKHNIAKFEFLIKLPGSMGGIIAMNAGAKEYEVFNNLLSINTKNGLIAKKEIDYGYRFTNIKTVIFQASFKLKKGFNSSLIKLFLKMRSNQPSLKSAGSCFINPPNNFAGKLIEDVGLKGEKIGEISFSDIHANFLVNIGKGKFEDAISCINLAKKKIKEKFNIHLKTEIIIIK